MALDLGYFFDLPHFSKEIPSRIADYKIFMERVVGAPIGSRKTTYRALEDVEEPDVVDEQGLDSEEIHLNNQDTSIKSIRRVRREKWDLEDQDKLSVVNIISNGVVDSIGFLEENCPKYTMKDGEELFTLKRSFYAIIDVRSGSLDRIVE
ncbi:hypothetical protein BGX20_009076 [Mortierella sp. AD010]|nr:hypothetical protein BGX20_009076 [Mortierella sp. AD010]